MKLRVIAVVSWIFAALFVLFLAPELEARKWSDLVENYETTRVSFKVLTAPTSTQGFNGSANWKVKVQLLEPEFAHGKKGDVTFTRGKFIPSASYEAIVTFRPSRSSQDAFRGSLKHLIRTVAKEEPDIFAKLRAAFVKNVRGVSPDSAALVSGLAIGDDSKLSNETKENFKTVSLTHLTAVSGANCAIVLGAFGLLIYRLPLRRLTRTALSLSVIALYLLLVGFEPSVLRASAMVALVLLAFATGRRVNPIDALALSVIALLLFDPKLSLSFGFSLSVLATLGLLALAPKLFDRWSSKMPQWLALGLSVTVAAQVACLPVLLMLQPSIPVYSVLANLLAEPMVVPITILGLVSCIVSPFSPALAGLAAFVASIPASWIIEIARRLAKAPYASIPWFEGSLGIVLGFLFALGTFLLFQNRFGKLRLLASGVTGLILVAFISQSSVSVFTEASFYTKPTTIVNCDVGQGDALVIRSKGQVAVIDVGRENPAIDTCLTRLGVNEIDLLVLTHYDMDHIGGVVGAVSGRKVQQVLVSGFKDDRPGAHFAENYLAGLNIPVESAEKGMTGLLGEFSWEVLSPHRSAPEAEDSNDGSISMLWQNSQLALITLADLGERGQLRVGAEGNALFESGFGKRTVIVKVAHHGSADQAPEFYDALKPDIALISVGERNSYGHPTSRCLS
ncbi:MAG: ComEC/Rec2 family competence protein, partial [Microbacteriaceae bacterium]|nr:ComEC/Rec2 family competence protein [Microbacteriaceae bacterium]